MLCKRSRGFIPLEARSKGAADTRRVLPLTGFTLIELLVVIAIIGMLSSIVLASMNSARSKANDAKRMADLHQVQLALELYYSDNGSYPALGGGWALNHPSYITQWNALQSALAPYLARLPKDPLDPYNPPSNTGYISNPYHYLSSYHYDQAGNIYYFTPGTGYMILAYPQDQTVVNKGQYCHGPQSWGWYCVGVRP